MNRRSVLSIDESKQPVNERLLSVRLAADQLGVSVSWLYGSNIPSVKLGRRKLYRPSDLTRYVNAHVSHKIESEDL